MAICYHCNGTAWCGGNGRRRHCTGAVIRAGKPGTGHRNLHGDSFNTTASLIAGDDARLSDGFNLNF